MRKLVCGIGVNDANYAISPKLNGRQVKCPFYRAWAAMLQRCYSEAWQLSWPTYIGCTVATEWHYFMPFKAWMEKQDWQGKDLDKDILVIGNKVYGPDTCAFVDRSINNLFSGYSEGKGLLPQGVCHDKQTGKYIARIRRHGKHTNLGRFKTPEKAATVYREARYLYILSFAEIETDIRVKQGLYRHSELFR